MCAWPVQTQACFQRRCYAMERIEGSVVPSPVFRRAGVAEEAAARVAA